MDLGHITFLFQPGLAILSSLLGQQHIEQIINLVALLAVPFL